MESLQDPDKINSSVLLSDMNEEHYFLEKDN